MKKIISLPILLMSCSLIIAQTEFDAYRYSQSDINGTARYMSMAGAFGALGGDASGVKDNPAGLGVYRKSELTGTLNFMMQNSTSNWQYKATDWKNSFGYDNLYKANLNNISFVLAGPTSNNSTSGLQSSNWSFAYNRLKNFDRNVNIKSGPSSSSITDYMSYFSEGLYPIDFAGNTSFVFNQAFMPTLSVYGYEGYMIDSVNPGIWTSSIGNAITPSYKLYEKGHLDEYSFGWSGNFSNTFYFGATLNFRALNYNAIGKYGETFGSEGYLNIGDTLYTQGNGINLAIGTIFRPTDNIRLGLSVHTPTIYSISDKYYSTFEYQQNDYNKRGTIVGPGIRDYYKIQDPIQINASMAYVIGTKGLVSAEYDYRSYQNIKYMTEDGNSQDFSDENDGMKQMLRNSGTVKLGGEYKLNDNFSLRAGYAYTMAGTAPDAEKWLRLNAKRVDTEYFLHNNTNYLTAGLGYREANWFIDFAYMHKTIDQTFYPYRSSQLNYVANPASVITTNNNMVVTLGLRF